MRSEEHIRGEEGQRLCEHLLPREWNKIPARDHDYGLDLVVQVFERGQDTGLLFSIQVRGTRRIRLSKGHVKHRIKTKHLKQYLVHHEPVFFVVSDLAGGGAYWLFMQQYICESVGNEQLERQRTVTVSVPLCNRLQDYAGLRDAVRLARQYMANLYPGSPDAAIREEISRWEKLDPRFKVRVVATPDGTHYTLSARADAVPVRLTFSGSGDIIGPKLRDFLGRGLPTVFGSGEIAVDGSDLFRELVQSLGPQVEVRPGPLGTLALGFSVVDESERHIARLPDIQATIWGGPAEHRVTGTLGGILNVSIVEPVGASTELSFDLLVDADWIGKPVLDLPYFDVITSFFAALREHPRVRMTNAEINRHLASALVGTLERSGVVTRLWPILDLLSKARAVARYFGVNPRLTHLDEGAVRSVWGLHRLISGEQLRTSAPNFSCSARVERDRVALLLAAPQPRGPSLVLERPETVDFLGEPLELRVRLHYTHTRLSSPAALRRELRTGHPWIPVRWHGTKDTERIVKLMRGGEQRLTPGEAH